MYRRLLSSTVYLSAVLLGAFSMQSAQAACSTGTSGADLSIPSGQTTCIDNSGSIGNVTVGSGITTTAVWSVYGGGTAISNEADNGNSSITSITIPQ